MTGLQNEYAGLLIQAHTRRDAVGHFLAATLLHPLEFLKAMVRTRAIRREQPWLRARYVVVHWV